MWVTEISLLVSASKRTPRQTSAIAPDQWENVRRIGGGGAGPFPPHRHDLGRVRLPVRRGRRSPMLVVADAIRFAEIGRRPCRTRRHHRHGHTGGHERPGRPGWREAPALTLIAHLLDDTRGTGLVNALAAYEAGVRHFDCSFGGVGGHPAVQVKYGGGYTGNVCTEDLINLLELLGIPTGIDLDALLETVTLVRADPRPRAARAGHPKRASIRCCGKQAKALGHSLGLVAGAAKMGAPCGSIVLYLHLKVVLISDTRVW